LTLQEDPHEAFTFVYQGNSQILDHLLASPALSAHVVAVDILHFNASFPHAWTEDETTSLRSSDHDAVEARFVLRK
jgi:predicted extracellular nuclease